MAMGAIALGIGDKIWIAEIETEIIKSHMGLLPLNHPVPPVA